ncbi:MAG TPA: sodium:solute symporter [Bacteroidetes bacterium]|nr:sodium:solute symporter [Bacteroidota bacterium]
MSSLSPQAIMLIIVVYFLVLILISYFTGKEDSNDVFFRAKRQAPWYLVAFGMIGASLSGITFISVPGWVEEKSFAYLQMVLGFVVGYFIIANVLLPLYYRMNLTSIYEYLNDRFGEVAHKTGSVLFLIARIAGASLRLFLVAGVLQLLIFDELGIPFWVTSTITIILIWVYTFKGGIKTIIWTDTLQTFFMLVAMIISMVLIAEDLNLSFGDVVNTIKSSPYSKIFFFDDYNAANYFWKQFLAGIFIAIAMTGLDQGMMQKNLTVKNLKESKKNMYWFSISLFFVNLLFLSLGVLLLLYANKNGIDLEGMGLKGDKIFPYIAVKSNLGISAAIFFILGLIAAAYSSADSSMTAITTSVSLDIFEIDKKYPKDQQKRMRKKIHIAISILFIFILILYKLVITDNSIISSIFTFAGYTYGPLLGLFTFGLTTKYKVKDRFIPLVVVLSPILTYIISILPGKLGLDYQFSFELLLINAAITFFGLWLLRKKS